MSPFVFSHDVLAFVRLRHPFPAPYDRWLFSTQLCMHIDPKKLSDKPGILVEYIEYSKRDSEAILLGG